ncbi:hypothetical protein [Streptomyces sp. UH6]|uniref:hypothetical protein n=1 Tax=Streptomyces sp. UH6 TaxID=2748379 RepID=UPI00211E0E64|nr:hypothetical protein [Streptomyces sp. UH6]
MPKGKGENTAPKTSGAVDKRSLADWAGNSVPVLLSTYARCITGQIAELQRRIEGPQTLPAGVGSPAPRAASSARRGG